VHEELSNLFLSAGITSQALIGYIIYNVIFFALLPLHSAKFRRLVWPAALCIAVVFFGLFGWAINFNNGKTGDLLTPKVHLSRTAKSFVMLYAITTAAGSSTAYSSRMSDWTRFSRSKNTPAVPALIGSLIFGSLTSVLGILATNAVHTKSNVVQWNPLGLLIYVQETHYTPACRAATFFAGLALFWSLIIVSSSESVCICILSTDTSLLPEQPHGENSSRWYGLRWAVPQIYYHSPRFLDIVHHWHNHPAMEISYSVLDFLIGLELLRRFVFLVLLL
jgi:cytosine/uracil/thiamine/allantoin permease